MEVSVLVMILVGAGGLLSGLLLATLTPYRRMRIRRKVMCFFGKHVDGAWYAEVGGRHVQRCGWCDKVIRERKVTVDEAKRDNVQRIF